MKMKTLSIGQIAYEAWCKVMDALASKEVYRAPWDQLTIAERAAWGVIANRVAASVGRADATTGEVHE